MQKLLILLTATALMACRSPAEPDDRWAIPENIQYAAALAVDLPAMTRTSTGLYVQDLVEGTGATALVGRRVKVHYTGWLPDGTVFESSYESGQPLDPFILGIGLVIRGWDEGLVGMKVGGRRKLVIRPELAYGRPGRGRIPPLTTLIFDVELLEVR